MTKNLSTPHNHSLVACPFTGLAYSMAISHTSGKLHLSALHPLLTATLPPSQALKLGTEWLMWRGLHSLHLLGGLHLSAPIPASYFGASIHKAVELVQELGCMSHWRKEYPAYRHSADTSPESLLAWLEATWQAYTGSGSLSFQSAEERSSERKVSSKLDDACRVQAARKAAQGIRTYLASVADTMLDLQDASGWSERHSAWLLATAGKACPALSVLQLVKAKLQVSYPQEFFVGTKRTQELAQVLQHLDTCILQQATELAQFAMSAEDEMQAALAIEGIQAGYAGLGLTSKIGYVVMPASSKTGTSSTESKMAQVIAARLQAALEQSASLQEVQAAPKLLPVDSSTHPANCPCVFCKPQAPKLLQQSQHTGDCPCRACKAQANAALQPPQLTPMQRALAARAAQALASAQALQGAAK